MIDHKRNTKWSIKLTILAKRTHPTFLKIIKGLTTENHYQTLLTKIAYVLEIWYFKNQALA